MYHIICRRFYTHAGETVLTFFVRAFNVLRPREKKTRSAVSYWIINKVLLVIKDLKGKSCAFGKWYQETKVKTGVHEETNTGSVSA